MNPLLDRCRPALARIVDPQGATLGTGAVISTDGHVLTCHHVIAGRSELRVEGFRAAASGVVVAADPSRDLAVLRVDSPVGDPLPIGADERPPPGTRFWTAGFQHQSAGVTGALSAEGHLEQPVAVRYAHELTATRYAIEVLPLIGDPYAQGLSGAPLVAVDSGAAVGVVTSRLAVPDVAAQGFAVPLGGRRDGRSEVDSFLDRNRQEVARFGTQLNEPGVLDLCWRQRQQAVSRYEANRVYLPDRYVDRSRIQAQLAERMASDRGVMALVGPSGTGKSSLLAHLAVAFGERAPVLLLRGIDVAAGHRDISELVDAALRTAAPGYLPASAPARLLADAGPPLVLLLDGLNEAELALGAALRSWLILSAEWLAEAGARLVVSSRMEFWQKAAGALAPSASGDDSLVAVDDFDPDELATAYAGYGMASTATAGAVGRLAAHPLFVRMVADVGAGTATELTLGSLLERYVATICERVALSTGTSAWYVRTQLQTAVRNSLEHGYLWQPRQAFGAVFGSLPLVGDALIAEHLFTPVREGVAVTFDSIGEYLLSRDQRLASADELRGGLSAPVRGAQVFLLLDAESAGDHEAVEAWLLAALDASEGQAGELLYTVLDALAELREPWRYGAAIARVAAGLVGRSYHDGMRGYVALRLIGNERLPAADRLDLARLFAPSERFYGWRTKDWDRYQGPKESDGGFGTAVTTLVRSHPEVLVRLADWLDDARPLDSSPEATVADIAGSLMWWYGDLAFADLCAAIAGRPGNLRLQMLMRFAEGRAEDMYGLIRVWSERAAPTHQHEYAYGLIAEHAAGNGFRLPARWMAPLVALSAATDRGLHDQVLVLRLALAPEDSQLLTQVRDRYRSSTDRHPGLLRPLVAAHPQLVLELISDDLLHGEDVSVVCTAVELLGVVATDRRVSTQAAALLSAAVRQAQRNETVGTIICLTLRDAITRAYYDAELAMPTFEIVTAAVSTVRSIDRRELLYAVTAPATRPAAAVLREQIVEFLATEADDELRTHALIGLIDANQLRTDIDAIGRVINAMPGSLAARVLIGMAYYAEDLAGYLLGDNVDARLVDTGVPAAMRTAAGAQDAPSTVVDRLVRRLIVEAHPGEQVPDWVFDHLAGARQQTSADHAVLNVERMLTA
jgi:hypothetical protein